MDMAGKDINQAKSWESLDQATQFFKRQHNEEGEETTSYKQKGQDQKFYEVIELSRRRRSACGGESQEISPRSAWDALRKRTKEQQIHAKKAQLRTPNRT